SQDQLLVLPATVGNKGRHHGSDCGGRPMKFQTPELKNLPLGPNTIGFATYGVACMCFICMEKLPTKDTNSDYMWNMINRHYRVNHPEMLNPTHGIPIEDKEPSFCYGSMSQVGYHSSDLLFKIMNVPPNKNGGGSILIPFKSKMCDFC